MRSRGSSSARTLTARPENQAVNVTGADAGSLWRTHCETCSNSIAVLHSQAPKASTSLRGMLTELSQQLSTLARLQASASGRLEREAKRWLSLKAEERDAAQREALLRQGVSELTEQLESVVERVEVLAEEVKRAGGDKTDDGPVQQIRTSRPLTRAARPASVTRRWAGLAIGRLKEEVRVLEVRIGVAVAALGHARQGALLKRGGAPLPAELADEDGAE